MGKCVDSYLTLNYRGKCFISTYTNRYQGDI